VQQRDKVVHHEQRPRALPGVAVVVFRFLRVVPGVRDDPAVRRVDRDERFAQVPRLTGGHLLDRGGGQLLGLRVQGQFDRETVLEQRLVVDAGVVQLPDGLLPDQPQVGCEPDVVVGLRVDRGEVTAVSPLHVHGQPRLRLGRRRGVRK
jgi:hypothetical protein